MIQSIKYATTIHEVSESFDVSIPYFVDLDNQKRFNSNPAKLKVVTDVKALFDPNRVNYLNPNLRNKTIINNNNLYISQIKVGLNVLVADVPNSVFTDDDKRILNIIVKGKGTPIIVVTYSPNITIKHAAYLQMTIQITNPTTPNSKAMPHGHSFFLETCIAAEGLADKDIVFGTGVNVTSANHIIQFQVGDVGKTCYMRGSYENGHHQRGPVSVIISKVIS